MLLKRRQNAFSLVELMILLLTVSLITAALVPVITKKHFRLPSRADHGAYMCYYDDDGKLREAKWTGRADQKLVFDRETNSCVFNPPAKAAYFQISAIGGGGGGGDAGYSGGELISGWSEEMTLSPFGITEEKLESLNMDVTEFKKYAGKLYAYATSKGSGAGGNISYAVKTGESTTTCPSENVIYNDVSNCVEYKTLGNVTGTKCYIKSYDCRSSQAGGTTSGYHSLCSYSYDVTTSVYDTKYESQTCVKTGGGCTASHSRVSTTNEHTYQGNCTSDCTDKAVYDYTCENGVTFTADTGSKDKSGTCKQTGQHTECVKNDELTCDTLTMEEEVLSDVCNSYSGGTESYECGTWVTDTSSYTDSTETQTVILDSQCNSLSTGERYRQDGSGRYYMCYGDEDCCGTQGSPIMNYILVCEDSFESGDVTEMDEVCTKYVTSKQAVGCSEYVTNYGWSTEISEGEPGGSGANCLSSSAVSGNVNLTNTYESNLSDVFDGASKTNDCVGYYCIYADCANSGYASCISGNKTSCDDPTYSYYAIKSGSSVLGSATAYSAAAGGAGGCRASILQEGSDEEIDWPESYVPTAKDGTCGSDSSSFTTTSSCGTGVNGYCLQHYGSSSKEENGEYTYQYSYDSNYLQYGNPGEPGEYKTVVVRSLDGVNGTIKIGRGGAAAAFNLGGDGSPGSSTSFGSIISAAGGAGGTGGNKTTGYILPKYDATTYDREKTCYGSSSSGCSSLTYIYHIISGQLEGEYPTPIGIASSIMNFIFKKDNDSAAIQKFKYLGKGGTGGGVEHRCWAGRFEVKFEGQIMDETSVYESDLPDDCSDDWDNIEAGSGGGGALLIKW